MPAVARVGIELPAINRFELADLSRHGAWLVPRLVTALEVPEQRLAGWLRSVIGSNDYLCLAQEHSVGLAEMQRANGLADKPVIKERFVLCQDIDKPEYVKEAAGFYDEFKRWAKGMSAEVIIVGELTDVPIDMIKEKLGRIHTHQQQFARV